MVAKSGASSLLISISRVSLTGIEGSLPICTAYTSPQGFVHGLAYTCKGSSVGARRPVCARPGLLGTLGVVGARAPRHSQRPLVVSGGKRVCSAANS